MSSPTFQEEDTKFVTQTEFNEFRNEMQSSFSDIMKALQALQDQSMVAAKNDTIQNATLEEASKVVAGMKQETIHDKEEEDRKIAEVENNVEATQQTSDNLVNELRTSEASNA